jgi:hypothetical protein
MVAGLFLFRHIWDRRERRTDYSRLAPTPRFLLLVGSGFLAEQFDLRDHSLEDARTAQSEGLKKCWRDYRGSIGAAPPR